jgi:predicted outer membrane repeat protein
MPVLFAASQSCVQLPQPFSVTSVRDVLQLAQALNCSNGSFGITWCGRVTVPETIVVGARTELTITSCADKAAAVIDGGNSTQLFNVDGQLHLVNVTLQDAYSADVGSAVQGQVGSQLTAVGTSILGSTGDTYGAIYTAGRALLTDCMFLENVVTLEEFGTFAGQRGAAVHGTATSELEIVSSTFVKNKGMSAVFATGKALFSSSRFESNTAQQRGGAINLATLQPVDIKDCLFLNNSIFEDIGGAVFGVNNMVFTNCSFISNSAPAVGGAVAVVGGTLTVTDCRFTGNRAFFAGAIMSYLSTFTTITASTFDSNFALDSGGAFYGFPRSVAVISNSTFIGNRANAGAALYTKSNVTVTDCIFDRQAAVTVGAAIDGADGSYVTVKDTTFTHGTATSGAAIYSVNKLSVANCTFDNHTATVAGGAIYSTIGSNNTIKNSTFTSGTAASGAAVYSQAVMTIDSCAFTTNTANTAGGSVYCDACTLTTSSSTFSNNNCTNGDGGAMYIKGIATIRDSNFTANDAIAHGGAIAVSNSTTTQTLQLSNIQFLQNTAGRAGAAIFSNGVYIDTSIIVDSSTSFQQNTAVCCYAQGIGSAVTSSSIDNSTCQDIDSGGERGAECCGNGQYTDGQHCITCSNEFNCEALGTTTATLPLRPGYWRVDLRTQSVLECWESSACSGGNAISSVQEYCANGYTGPCKYCCVVARYLTCYTSMTAHTKIRLRNKKKTSI